jgi:uncharacterized repeat protein (TIGR01451 family)
VPRHWRWVLIALSTLILCSCRAPITTTPPPLPQETVAGADQYSQPAPLPYAPVGPWAPPGIAGPWPADEYLVDGGDRGLPAEVSKDWRINGLESEDTIAHFDTLDGRTLVEPSNPVPIYAPRFCSVRQVVGLVQGEQIARPGGVEQPVSPARQDDRAIAASSKQNVEAIRQNSSQPPIIYRGKVGDGAVSGVQLLGAYQDAFQPYENLKMLREGKVDQKENARLAAGIAAAIVWSDTDSLQIILDHQSASVAVTDRKATDVYTVDEPPGCPKLRVIKVASTQVAEPGDVIDFTIRFDNVGNQPIGNVTIVDNLAGRLEFVPGSAQSSRGAEFRTESNEVGSEVLRWEIKDPLPVAEGGVVRFQCRVR